MSVDVTLYNSIQDEFKMILEPPGFIEDMIIMNKAWEPQLVQVISKVLKYKGAFLDIGANIGFHSLYIASDRPDVTCICFEPHPTIYKQLLRNTKINEFNNIITHNLGVGNSSQEIEFYMQTENNYNKALSSFNSYKDIGEYTKESIQVVALDDFLDEEIKKEISVIKIDTQGFEYQVIQGAADLIEKYQPVITFEYHRDENRSLDDILSLLPYYRIFKIQPWSGVIRSIEMPDPEGFANDFLCIPPNIDIPFEIEKPEEQIKQGGFYHIPFQFEQPEQQIIPETIGSIYDTPFQFEPPEPQLAPEITGENIEIPSKNNQRSSERKKRKERRKTLFKKKFMKLKKIRNKDLKIREKRVSRKIKLKVTKVKNRGITRFQKI